MRYAGHLPLPPYTYVPGRSPHPLSDPRGHQLMGVTFVDAEINLAYWRASPAYCYGLDLFNGGYYWEAHEVWETLWKAAGRSGPVANFLKGLIKLAAALVKALEGRSAGVRRHAGRAAELFRSLPRSAPLNGATATWGGLGLADLVLLAERIAEEAERLAAGEIAAPFVSYQLVPLSGLG